MSRKPWSGPSNHQTLPHDNRGQASTEPPSSKQVAPLTVSGHWRCVRCLVIIIIVIFTQTPQNVPLSAVLCVCVRCKLVWYQVTTRTRSRTQLHACVHSAQHNSQTVHCALQGSEVHCCTHCICTCLHCNGCQLHTEFRTTIYFLYLLLYFQLQCNFHSIKFCSILPICIQG